MTAQEQATAMEEDRVAGAVVIPAEFDRSIASLRPGAPGVATRPTVSIAVNAGDGGLSNGLVIGNVTPLLRGVAHGLGDQLTAASGGAALPAANAALLADPFEVVSAPYSPLPDNSGLGTSAFYYSLILILLSFIGASLVGPLVDSSLGVIPSEIGPLVARQPYTAVSRRATFLGKAAILVLAAPFAALALQLVAASFGVGASDFFGLWLYSTAAVMAVGVSALAVFAALGPGIGSIVNTLFFVALAMVSSGGIVPLEATPPFFGWVSQIAPFRYVIDGVRSLFYFDGNLAAGLRVAWFSVAIGGIAGLLVGLVITTFYDRVRKFSRHPRVA
jgi:hypothetical protein